MDHSSAFRRTLAQRIGAGLGITLLASSAMPLSGCGAKVVIDEAGGGGAGGTDASSSSSGNPTSSTGTGIPTCDPNSGMQQPFLGCLEPPLNGGCADKATAAPALAGLLDACSCLLSVDVGPKSGPAGTNLCCYDTTIVVQCVVGRALRSSDGPLVADVEVSAERGWSEEALGPNVEGLSDEARGHLASRWVRDGLFEHASVASFSRLGLSLLAVSAHAELVEAAHQAAIDEVRHAKRSFSMAKAYRGEAMEPARLPIQSALAVETDCEELAVASLLDGAIGETLAAALAAEQAAVATDPAVRRVLLGIAEDEGRHAKLGFQVVAFAMAAGGERVKDAVRKALAEARHRLPEPPAEMPLPAALLHAHGNLKAAEAKAVFAKAMEEVVLPIAAALLA